MDPIRPLTPELRLPLASTSIVFSPENEAVIRHILGQGMDWARFARKAIGYGQAGPAGDVLATSAPNLVQDELSGCLVRGDHASHVQPNVRSLDDIRYHPDKAAQTGDPSIVAPFPASDHMQKKQSSSRQDPNASLESFLICASDG